MNKVGVLLVVVFLIGAISLTSCQTTPIIGTRTSEIKIFPTREFIENDLSSEVYFVLSSSFSDIEGFIHVEAEALPYRLALIKAKAVSKVKLFSHEIYRENPEPLDDSQLLSWRTKVENLIEKETIDLNAEIDSISGVKEKLLLNYEDYWWMDYGILFFKQYTQEVSITDGTLINVTVDYILIEVKAETEDD